MEDSLNIEYCAFSFQMVHDEEMRKRDKKDICRLIPIPTLDK